MAASAPPKLRLFTTFEQPTKEGHAASGKAAADADAASLPRAAAAGSNPWGPHHFWTSQHDLPTTSLILTCLAAAHSGADAPAGFDAEEGSGRQQGSLAMKVAAQLVPGWRALTLSPIWRWQTQLLLESPCMGVPGLRSFTAARAAWVAGEVQLAIDADGCRQVVVLRAGYGTLSHSLAQEGVRFFEADCPEVLRSKKAALDAVLPGWRRSARRPRFVEVDLLAGSLELITHLTAAGLDPAKRCCIVAEGLLPYLPAERGQALLKDLSALAAPGSRLLFDFLHAGPASGLPGFASFSAAVANKGAPLCSGLAPAFSAVVHHLQPHHFRLASLLAPQDIARLSLEQPRQQQQQQGKAAGKAAASTERPAKLARLAQHAASPAAASAGAAAAPVSRQQLPYVPEFWSLASAVRENDRLLLRHSDASPAAADEESALPLTAWAAAGAAAALSSPSCLLRSLAWLWGGSGSSSSSSSSASPAPLPLEAPPGPLQSAFAAAPQRQASVDWKLGAVRDGSPSPAAHSQQAASAGSSAGGASSSSRLALDLQTAASIEPLPASRRAGSSGHRSSSSSTLSPEDCGHLHASAASSGDAGIQYAPSADLSMALAAAARGETGSGSWSWGDLLPSFSG